MHILLVEDEPILLNVAARILERAGYDVSRATSTEAALDIAVKQRPDLLMTDILLPDQDGFELMLTLRTQYPELPVLIWTGRPVYKLHELLDGIQGIRVLQKPVSGTDIVQHVGEALAESREQRRTHAHSPTLLDYSASARSSLARAIDFSVDL